MSGNGASKSKAIRAKLSHPVIDSDGHWREYGLLALDCLREEAWELVEEKGMAEEDFQASTFGNAVKFWASLNSDFFKGTVIESQVRKLQARPRHA